MRPIHDASTVAELVSAGFNLRHTMERGTQSKTCYGIALSTNVIHDLLAIFCEGDDDDAQGRIILKQGTKLAKGVLDTSNLVAHTAGDVQDHCHIRRPWSRRHVILGNQRRHGRYWIRSQCHAAAAFPLCIYKASPVRRSGR